METIEMLKEVKKDANKEFRRIDDGLIMSIGINGVLNWESGYMNISLYDEWEEVKKPVDFMTAFKAHRDGQAIRVENDGEGKMYYPTSRGVFYAEDIENGKWYIED